MNRRYLSVIAAALFLTGCGGGSDTNVVSNGNSPSASPVPNASPAVPQSSFTVPSFGANQVATLILRSVPPTETTTSSLSVGATVTNRQEEGPRRDLSPAVMERELTALREVRGKTAEPAVGARYQQLPEGASVSFYISETGRTINCVKLNAESETIHCTLFAEVNGSGATVLSKGQALAVAQGWDLNNPFKTGQGIYDQVRAVFGSEWVQNGGRDGDTKVNLVFLSSGSIGGANLFGFFRPTDELTKSEAPTSNEGEILYLNADKATGDLFDLLSTAGHEFQHLIDWNVKFGRNGALNGQMENATINEGKSCLAEELLGYGLSAQGGASQFIFGICDQYLKRTADQPFFEFDNSQGAYGKGYWLFRYINDRFGTQAVTSIAISPNIGKDNIERQLNVSFRSLFDDWTLTNLVSPLANPPAGFQHNGVTTASSFTVRNLGQRTLPGVVPQSVSAPPTASVSRSLSAWAAYYAEYSQGTGNTLTVNVNQNLNTDANLVVQSPRGTYSSKQ